MKRPALQNKQVVVLRMSFRAWKVLGTFEKRAPGPNHWNMPHNSPNSIPLQFVVCQASMIPGKERKKKRLLRDIYEIQRKWNL